ncbi:hypothetical protein N431DRAFT_465548 [Stipitochalara longipes BDJ]|nr:hypothetical protein N431DRAFT_465548 [Stipitochalara longipes BDJ]
MTNTGGPANVEQYESSIMQTTLASDHNLATQQNTASSSTTEVQWVLIGKFVTKAKGVSYRVHSTATRERLLMNRNPNNEYDINAINVFNASSQGVGFLDKELASILAPRMDSGAIRLQGKTIGLRGSRWTWRRPNISVRVFARPDGVDRRALEGAGVVFSDSTQDTSSTDGELDSGI